MPKLRLTGSVVLPTGPTVKMADLLAILDVSRETFRAWREIGFPPGHKDGRSKFFIVADVAEWLEDNDVKVRR